MQEREACLPACVAYLAGLAGAHPSIGRVTEGLCSIAGEEALTDLLHPIPELAALNFLDEEMSCTMDAVASAEAEQAAAALVRTASPHMSIA